MLLSYYVALDNPVKETPGLLRERANSRAGAGNIQDKPRIYYYT